MKIKITDIHPNDEFYIDRADLIGKEGTLLKLDGVWDDGCSYGTVIIPDFRQHDVYFHAFKYEEVGQQEFPAARVLVELQERQRLREEDEKERELYNKLKAKYE